MSIEPEVIAIGGRIIERPDRLAGEGVHRLNGLSIVDAMKQDQAIANDRRSGKSRPDITLPDQRRTGARKRRHDRRSGVDAVAIGSENLRPVLSNQRRAECNQHQNQGLTARRPDRLTACPHLVIDRSALPE